MEYLDIIIDIILLVEVIGLQSILWFVYWKNYRFATLFTDMLPYYPYIIGFNIGIHVIYVFVVDTIVIQVLMVISLITSVYQIKKFLTWHNDYRLTKYEEMLQTFVDHPNIEFIAIRDYIDNPDLNKDKIYIIMRHDVDINLKRTRNMIDIERKLRVPSCYYFRTHAERFTFDEAQEIIQDIKDEELFEVGFHYESISAKNGDLDAAAEYFKEELQAFREIYPKLTFVSAHGDKHVNRRLIKNDLIDIDELNIISSYDIEHDHYISEIGGNKSHPSKEGHKRFVTRMDDIKHLPKGTIAQILVHADWWF